MSTVTEEPQFHTSGIVRLTVAVQNVAPRAQMGAATASTIFLRAIGSTVGVALFGSVLLTNYHAEFGRRLPPGVPQEGMKGFNNPPCFWSGCGRRTRRYSAVIPMG